MRNKGLNERSTLSANGRVSLRRRRWQAAGEGSVVPVDTLLDAAEATVSRGTRELCCRINATSGSFARAAADLKHVGQLSLSPERLRQVVEAEGQQVLQARQSGALKPDWQAKDCPALTPQGQAVTRVYLGVDGFFVPLLTEPEKQARRQRVVAKRRRRSLTRPKLPPLPTRKKGADQRWKEVKLIQFHSEAMEHRLVSVTRQSCQEAGRIMRRDAVQIGFAEALERIGNVDGSVWIVHQIQRRGLLLSGLGLDFYHLGEHVNQAKRETFGQANAGGEAWAGEVLHQAKHQGYEPFWDRLVQWRSQQRARRQKQAADDLLHYVSQRQKMICYEQFLARGWRISSSTTESQCGAVPRRIKGPGKRWDGDNAEAVMALEAMEQSHLWRAYWTTCAA